MRWLKLCRGGEPSDADPIEEAPTESVGTASVDDEEKVTESATEVNESAADEQPTSTGRRMHWSRVVAYALLPGVALLLALTAGFLKWQDGSSRDAAAARGESVHAATDSTIALLSYRPDTVERDLEAARSRLTGTFLNAYTTLTHDVVIPGAKQKQISAVATVLAGASIKATDSHAVVLLFVDQTVIVGKDAPTSTASSVRVTLDKVNGRWLIAGFDPV